MKRRLQILLQTTIILTVLGIGMQVGAQPSVVTEVPVNSTGFVTIGDLVYFTAGAQLWRTDGTADGTFVLGGFAQLRSFTEFQGDLYFLSNNELWRSDGTRSGTIQLHISGGDNLKIVGQTNDDLFFQDYQSATGLELYRTNGTTGGTMLVKDINPGPGDGFSGSAAAVGNYLFFAGNNGTEGRELWKSDGSSVGTVMVEDINPGAADGMGGSVLADNNLFYFVGTTTALDQPWVSDGTAEGTYQIGNIVPSPGLDHSIDYRIAHNGAAYFLVRGIDYDGSIELWTSRGTMATTRRAGAVGWDPMHAYSFLVYQDKIYFWMHSEPMNHLWASDGTLDGEVFNHQTGDGTIYYFDVVNDHLLFVGYGDGGRSTPIWRSDGTMAGTERAYIRNALLTQRDRLDFTTVNDLTFFPDHDGPTDWDSGEPHDPDDYLHLFQTDGFTTQSMRTMFGVSTVGANDITNFNGKVIFTTYDDRGTGGESKSLWIYDPNNVQEHHGTFTLVNADTDEDIKTLVEGDVITKSETENINIRFNPAQPPGSVRFALNGSNVRIENAAPYSLAGDASGNYNPWTGASPGSYTLTATPYSGSGAGGTAGTPVTIHFTIEADTGDEECMASGTILREYWDNVPGNHVAAIPVRATPTSTSNLNIFEGPTNVDTNYGARIRGYICPPATGDYTFWIASNDHSELWLSSDDDPSKKKKIAYITGATNPRQWDKFGTQKSAPVNLTAGKRYYIEALHKQGVGTDNLAVGWQLPDGTLERPIPGSRLSPGEPGENINPVVTIESPVTGQTFSSPATIDIHANATDEDGIMFVQFYAMNINGGHLFTIGEQDNTAPYSVTWSNVQPGNYLIRAEAQDNEGGFSTHEIMIEVVDQCNASGSISWEYWGGVQGNRVSDIPLDSPPTRTGDLSNFEGPVNLGTNYGSRIRGYVCAPATGDYYFSISSNDHSELWLSTDDNPANKLKIASVTGATNFQQYDKFSSQNSVAIPLIQGKSYYIEALHKQGVGTDHVSVAWTRPDVGFNGSIDGQYLSPFASDNSGSTARVGNTTDSVADAQFQQINIYPNPAQSGNRELNIAGYEDIEESVETDVEIINMAGEVVYAEKVLCGGKCGAYVMNINQQLVPGLYLVKLKTNGIKMSKRLLVK